MRRIHFTQTVPSDAAWATDVLAFATNKSIKAACGRRQHWNGHRLMFTSRAEVVTCERCAGKAGETN